MVLGRALPVKGHVEKILVSLALLCCLTIFTLHPYTQPCIAFYTLKAHAAGKRRCLFELTFLHRRRNICPRLFTDFNKKSKAKKISITDFVHNHLTHIFLPLTTFSPDPSFAVSINQHQGQEP